MKLLFSLDILGRVEVLNVKEKSEFWICGNLTVCHAAYSIAHWEDHEVEASSQNTVTTGRKLSEQPKKPQITKPEEYALF